MGDDKDGYVLFIGMHAIVDVLLCVVSTIKL